MLAGCDGAGLPSSDLDTACRLLAADPWLEPGMLAASVDSTDAKGCSKRTVPALLGVSGGPGGRFCEDMGSSAASGCLSAASGRLRRFIGAGGMGSVVKVAALSCCAALCC